MPSRQKRSLNTSNAEAGPSNSKRPRTTSAFDGLYDSDSLSNDQTKRDELRGYLVVDIVERAHDIPEAEWYRRVEIRARLEVFKLQLAGKAQSGPAVIHRNGRSMKIPWTKDENVKPPPMIFKEEPPDTNGIPHLDVAQPPIPTLDDYDEDIPGLTATNSTAVASTSGLVEPLGRRANAESAVDVDVPPVVIIPNLDSLDMEIDSEVDELANDDESRRFVTPIPRTTTTDNPSPLPLVGGLSQAVQQKPSSSCAPHLDHPRSLSDEMGPPRPSQSYHNAVASSSAPAVLRVAPSNTLSPPQRRHNPSGPTVPPMALDAHQKRYPNERIVHPLPARPSTVTSGSHDSSRRTSAPGHILGSNRPDLPSTSSASSSDMPPPVLPTTNDSFRRTVSASLSGFRNKIPVAIPIPGSPGPSLNTRSIPAHRRRTPPQSSKSTPKSTPDASSSRGPEPPGPDASPETIMRYVNSMSLDEINANEHMRDRQTSQEGSSRVKGKKRAISEYSSVSESATSSSSSSSEEESDRELPRPISPPQRSPQKGRAQSASSSSSSSSSDDDRDEPIRPPKSKPKRRVIMSSPPVEQTLSARAKGKRRAVSDSFSSSSDSEDEPTRGQSRSWSKGKDKTANVDVIEISSGSNTESSSSSDSDTAQIAHPKPAARPLHRFDLILQNPRGLARPTGPPAPAGAALALPPARGKRRDYSTPIPEVPHGRARSLLVPNSNSLPLMAVDMKGRFNFLAKKKQKFKLIEPFKNNVMPQDDITRRVSSSTVLDDIAIVGFEFPRAYKAKKGIQVTLCPLDVCKGYGKVLDAQGDTRDSEETCRNRLRKLRPERYDLTPYLKESVHALAGVHSGDGKIKFLSGGEDGSVHLWRVMSSGTEDEAGAEQGVRYKASRPRRLGLKHKSVVIALEYRQRDSSIFSCAGRNLWQWDLEGDQAVQQQKVSNDIYWIHTATKNFVVLEAQHKYRQITIYDTRTSFNREPDAEFGYIYVRKTNPKTGVAKSEETRFVHGAVDPSRNYFVRGFQDGVVKLWDFRKTKDVVETFIGSAHEEIVHTTFVDGYVAAYGDTSVDFWSVNR